MYEQLSFQHNSLFERMISEYLNNGYSIVNDWLSYDETISLRSELIDTYNDDLFKKSAIGNRFDENIIDKIRGDYIYWLDESKSANIFFNKINDFIEYLNKTCFAGIVTKEFHYAVYPTGTFYKKHIDTFQNDDKRTISIVCYLNQQWNENHGGELALYLENKTVRIHPTNGKMVIFDSKSIEHEVLPVLESERLSITGWLKTS